MQFFIDNWFLIAGRLRQRRHAAVAADRAARAGAGAVGTPQAVQLINREKAQC
ncbi:MAG: hypothetical protein MZW92_39890 [Comamonadaceae bacterium]|nr:hypothetical protein [Comamonadaceae bacterium]